MKEPSKYQQAIFEWVEAASALPKAALMVDAKAGSGKTTTIVEALKLIPKGQRVLFLAFNKHIAEELKRRVPENVEASTLNSFGWRICRSAVRGVKLDDWKVMNTIRDVVPDKKELRWSSALKRLISLKRANRSMSAEDILKMHDVEAPVEPRFMEIAKDVWKKAVHCTALMDFDDQIFMPVQKGWPIPQYDWVMVDEAQDLSEVQVELVKGIAPRVVAVGDPNQAIYGFRGAMPDAMDKMRGAIGAEQLPLSICYRCPKSVVCEAQSIVPEIEWAPNAAEGCVDVIGASSLRHQTSSGDWVLCRTTAPLVRECLKFIVAGIKATVKGRDIGQSLIGLIDKVNQGTDASPISEFSATLNEYYAHESDRLAAAERDAQLQALEDRVESIHALAEGARTVGDVKARILNTFKDEASPGVTFATAHRSKGLEARTIFVLRPDLMPFPKAKLEWQRKQEMNLKYVAITRAMERLVWVRE